MDLRVTITKSFSNSLLNFNLDEHNIYKALWVRINKELRQILAEFLFCPFFFLLFFFSELTASSRLFQHHPLFSTQANRTYQDLLSQNSDYTKIFGSQQHLVWRDHREIESIDYYKIWSLCGAKHANLWSCLDRHLLCDQAVCEQKAGVIAICWLYHCTSYRLCLFVSSVWQSRGNHEDLLLFPAWIIVAVLYALCAFLCAFLSARFSCDS